MNPAKYLFHHVGKWYCTIISRREYERQTFVRVNERPIEFRFLFDKLTQCCPQDVLDVGTGTTALPHLLRHCGFRVTAIDNVEDYWPKGMFNRHYYVRHDDVVRTRLVETFDFITCISVIEHIRDHALAVENMLSLLRPGGHLVITCPYSEGEYAADVYRMPEATYGKAQPYICQSFSRKEIEGWLAGGKAEIRAQEYWRCFTGRLWTFGDLVRPFVETTAGELHQLTCLLIRKPPQFR